MQAEPGVFEGGGSVLLEDEVSYPGESVSDDQYEEEVGEVECEQQCAYQLEEGEEGADHVQSAAGAVRVL